MNEARIAIPAHAKYNRNSRDVQKGTDTMAKMHLPAPANSLVVRLNVWRMYIRSGFNESSCQIVTFHLLIMWRLCLLVRLPLMMDGQEENFLQVCIFLLCLLNLF